MNSAFAATLFALGVTTGALVALILKKDGKKKEAENRLDGLAVEKAKRARLPSLVILVRHGESEGNADHSQWMKRPDNLLELSPLGVRQAVEAGRRVEEIFKHYDDHKSKPNIRRVHMIVSPFERSLQTAFCMRPHFEHRVVRTDVESRIREQEFGNLQGSDFQSFREEQQTVGRFWYRFPTGESGADVYDRVKSWWFESVLNVNCRVGYDMVDALVVVTHGLTMRFVLMQLFHWSPATFHSVWNANNCDMYVLEKNLQKPGLSPYVLDGKFGELPKSSVNVLISFKDGTKQLVKLNDYLSIPPPRTVRLEIVKDKLVEQYPTLERDDIVDILFTEPGNGQGKSWTKMSKERSCFIPPPNGKKPKQEFSCRFPNVPIEQFDEDPKERRTHKIESW